MDKFKRKQYDNLGPGGFKCPCCNQFRGSKGLDKKLNRITRAKMKVELNKIIEENIVDNG